MTGTMGRGSRGWLPALLLLAGWAALGEAKLFAQQPEQALPEELVRAWKEAGATVGWMGKGRFSFLEFQTMKDNLAGAVPAFQFVVWKEGRIAKLPDAGTTFGLDLGNTQVTDAGLKELAGLKGLQTLNLWGTQVTDAGLKELAGLKGLQTLYLNGTQVTDAGLKELAGLKGLQTLNLGGTQVTDAGLKELAGLKGLHLLVLTRTKVTDAGVGELQKALPGCRIFR